MATQILHHIKASLHQNNLANISGKYIARAASERRLNIREVCQAAVTRGAASGSALVMEQYINAFLKEWAYQLCDGYSVNTGYFTASVQVKGVFEAPKEGFDTTQHSVVFQIRQGKLLRRMLPGIKVDVLGLADVMPSIIKVYDVKQDMVNDRITPGKALIVSGRKLKLAGTHPDVGICFISATTRERTKVAGNEIVGNIPSTLTFMVPQLKTGTYHIEVSTQYNGGATLLKEPRTAVFDMELAVA